MMGEAGRDATDAFEDVGHSDEARALLKKYYVGEGPTVSFNGPKRFTKNGFGLDGSNSATDQEAHVVVDCLGCSAPLEPRPRSGSTATWAAVRLAAPRPCGPQCPPNQPTKITRVSIGCATPTLSPMTLPARLNIHLLRSCRMIVKTDTVTTHPHRPAKPKSPRHPDRRCSASKVQEQSTDSQREFRTMSSQCRASYGTHESQNKEFHGGAPGLTVYSHRSFAYLYPLAAIVAYFAYRWARNLF